MPAFRQVLAFSGVDERTATGNVGIIVPLRGSNVVILADGPTLQVESTATPAVQVEEITDPRRHPIWSKLIAAALSFESLKARAIRVFKISGNSLAGIDVAKVVARNDSTRKVEATLKVLVLKQKLVKISIRPTQVSDGQKKHREVHEFQRQRTDAARPDESRLGASSKYCLSTCQDGSGFDRRPIANVCWS